MAHRDDDGFFFQHASRLIILAAAHWAEVSGAYRSTGKALAEQDVTTVCEFTLAYFVNTNEFRADTRKELMSFLNPGEPILDAEGNDTRSFEAQKDGLMDDFLQMLPEKED